MLPGTDPLDAFIRVGSYLRHYKEAKLLFRPLQHHSSVQQWKKLACTFVKVNFDAAIKRLRIGCSLGVVVRSVTGSVMHWCRKFVPYICDPELGEAMAARLAAAVARRLGLTHVIFEGHYLRVITHSFSRWIIIFLLLEQWFRTFRVFVKFSKTAGLLLFLELVIN